MISIDFETRSKTNLLTEGAYNYATDPSTDIICMAYSVDGQEPKLWVPGMDVPVEFASATQHRCHAWNAAFERLLWDYVMVPDYGFAPVAFEQWRCTMFKSRANNMPGALGNAARCLSVPQQKSTRGRELIKLLCLPRPDGSFCEDEGLLWEMYEYCLQDVRTEQACDNQLREPTPEEWEDYYANERINDRGVRVDTDLCQAAQIYADEELADLTALITELTEGAVTKARGEKLKDWVVERLMPEQEKLLVKYRNGERKLSLDRYNRQRLLALDAIDPLVAEVVEASDFAQKSSVGKYKAMGLLADPDDSRVRGSLMANGASASGRYSSRGLQVHNFPRDCMDDPLEVRADFIDEIVPEDVTDYFEKPIMTVLSHMLRPSLIPAPGHKFLVSDWSAIEGRVGPWLCDNALGQAKLEQYANDLPVYEITAAATFRCSVEDVTKDQRQVGKVQELAFGFGGGAGAFLAMARNYGLQATKADAERYKDAWRRINPWGPHIWQDVERAARLAVQQPGRMFEAGRVSYFCVADILCGGLTLFSQLPCGRVLTYPAARIEMCEAPWGDLVPTLTYLRSAFLPKAGEKEWPRTSLWGGLLHENNTQGTAASLLRHAVRECEAEELPVVFHVHDEIVLEVADKFVDIASTALHGIMNTPPAWASSLPLKAEVDVMDRFGK